MAVKNNSSFYSIYLLIAAALTLLTGCQPASFVPESSSNLVDITKETAIIDPAAPIPPPPTFPAPASPTAHATSLQTIVTATAVPATPTLLPIPTAAATAAATSRPQPINTPTIPTLLPSEELPISQTFEIGRSLQGRPLFAHQFGQGPNKFMLVGGIHGGYEWNSIVLAHRLIDYFTDNPSEIPANVTLTIIPSANPDGHYLISGEDGNFDNADIRQDTSPGRFSANTINGLPVDLNRNWDCNWKPTALWRNTEVSGGTAPFSEPETNALRNFFLSQNPKAVIFLHSAANGVFVSGCGNLHAPSSDLATVYANAAAYPIFDSFDFYEITGDAGDWLTTQGIASISIELITHEAIEFDKNLNGVKAVLNYYGN